MKEVCLMSKKNIFTFVILHYYAIDETKKCVQSIMENCIDNYNIVIIDNNSKDKSGHELKKIYSKFNNVYVIINSENLGFAKGNNVGFLFAKEKLNSDFIILCNNDTILLQKNFCELIIENYNKYNFAVLGPKILLPSDKTNPVILEIADIKILKKQLINYKINYVVNLLYLSGIYTKLKKMLKSILFSHKTVSFEKNDINPDKQYENIVLHGCFLIFSKAYIDLFDGIDDRTFLYREEELLAIRLRKNNLINLYDPRIEIFHNEDSSTNAVTKTERRKQLFVQKNQIKSMKILISELMEVQND